jgi:putative serine protease PepD
VPNEAGQNGGGSVGIGFAVPVRLATPVADQLIANGRFTPPYLGLSTVPVTTTVDGTSTAGLFVTTVSAGSPADQAGLRRGDIVTKIDGRAVSGPDALILQTLRGRPDAAITLEYVRDDKTATATVSPVLQ